MRDVSKEEILHLAELSNIELSEAETASLKQDLTKIIEYVNQLDELDVSGVEPTYQVGNLENVMREDEIVDYGVAPKDLLELVADPQANVVQNQTKVPKVL